MSSSHPTLTATGKKKFIPKLYINLGRCRYEVIRDVAEEMGMCVDFDDEDLASTMTKTIEQPKRTSTSIPQQRSSRSLLANGNNLSRQPLFHDAVYKMIESGRSHIMWSDVTITPQQLSSCAVWQRLNHFPGISQTLSRKVPLGQTMMRAWKLAPEHFGELIPLSFSLKKDTPVLRQYFEEIEFSKKLKKRNATTKKTNKSTTSSITEKENDDDDSEASSINKKTSSAETVSTISSTNPFKDTKVFIFKPNAGCMGHDIKLTCNPLQMMQKLLTQTNVKLSKHLKEDEDFVCQSYIDRPMLIEKKKFDLRVYVLLMGVTPDLRVLIHEEGLVRICATEYVEPKASNVRKSTMHLTNYAVNKKTLKNTKQASSSVSKANDDDDENDNDERATLDEEEDENDENIITSSTEPERENNNTREQQEISPAIDGIKRDFKFFNSMLDRDYSNLGGSTEIWRRIDRAIIMSLIAAHPELDRTYRQASAGNQVLLKRTAQAFLKDLKAAREKEEDGNAAADRKNENNDGQDEDADDEENENDDNEGGSNNNEDTNDNNENQHQRSQGSILLDKITSEEEFISNCCIGRNCFELLGFDLLLTETGHPYIMEVNHGPSLETGAEIDLRIKSKVLKDSFNHLSVFLPDSTKKKHLRSRRYLQRICRRGGVNPMMDLEKTEKLNSDTGYRIAYPLVAPFKNSEDEKLADEYRRAKAVISPNTTSSNNTGESPITTASSSTAFGVNNANNSSATNSGHNSRTNSSRVGGKFTTTTGSRDSSGTVSSSLLAKRAPSSNNNNNLLAMNRRPSFTTSTRSGSKVATGAAGVTSGSSSTRRGSIDPRASTTMRM